MKVLFACPIFNFQDTNIRKNHEEVRKFSIHEVDYVEVVGASVEHAKQIMYREFLRKDYDYFFNVDADIMFLNYKEINPIDLLVEHCEEIGNAIVGGIYVYKRYPYQPAYRPKDLQEIYERDGKFPENYKFNIPKELFEVEWLAGGCMMINREIVEKLTKKFQVPNLPMIYKKEYLSEDFSFCKRARDMSYSIFAEPKIELGHSGPYLFTFNDYKI